MTTGGSELRRRLLARVLGRGTARRTDPGPAAPRALVLGFFSTFGDIQVLGIVRGWLDRAGIPSDVAPYARDVRAAMPGALDPRRADPAAYSHLVVVCGPCWPGLFRDLGIDLGAFAHCRRIGINLTMLSPLAEWNPFDVLVERGSDRRDLPDLSFLAEAPAGAVVGRCIVDAQPEYGVRQRHAEAGRLVDGLLSRRGLAAVELDTRWPPSRNRAGQPDLPRFLAMVSRLDAVVTTRLHGMVFALACGVPALAIDPVSGGDKVSAQARAVGWPVVLPADGATDTQLDDALDWCLGEEARRAAAGVRRRAAGALRAVEREVFDALAVARGGAPRG